MKTYEIGIAEVHYQVVEIEAESETEAMRLAKEMNDNGAGLTLEYSHTLGEEDWYINEQA